MRVLVTRKKEKKKQQLIGEFELHLLLNCFYKSSIKYEFPKYFKASPISSSSVCRPLDQLKL